MTYLQTISSLPGHRLPNARTAWCQSASNTDALSFDDIVFIGWLHREVAAQRSRNGVIMRHTDRSFRGEGDLSKLIEPDRERTQDLRGFDADYTDIVDYIVRSTHKIWEEGGMGLLYSHYQHNAKIHTPYGMEYGREAWLAASISGLSAFPDYRLYADDVIWSGNEDDGFYSSHRILGMGTNLGYSQYGPPTNRKIKRWVIANCYVKENRIVEEWVVRDESALVQQLGYDPVEVARKLVEQDRNAGCCSCADAARRCQTSGRTEFARDRPSARGRGLCPQLLRAKHPK